MSGLREAFDAGYSSALESHGVPRRLPKNPFRPGAGHTPPFLAGRQDAIQEAQRLLRQDVVLKNLVVTGLRGVGKTVLLEALKPLAMAEGWLWIGTDLSESASLSEERIAVRLLADLSVGTAQITLSVEDTPFLGSFAPRLLHQRLDHRSLRMIYDESPGLPTDKVKVLLELVCRCLRRRERRGLLFAYDEAQNLADHAQEREYPLSLLLEAFQSLQRSNLPLLLVLTGLPQLFGKLVAARTFAERMFHVLSLGRLDAAASREAILRPLEAAPPPTPLQEDDLERIIVASGGYPYFLQFIAREAWDRLLDQSITGKAEPLPIEEITRKLDTDFFAGRWQRATPRQRDLLGTVAAIPSSDGEFTVQAVVEQSQLRKAQARPFKTSHVTQMLGDLTEGGLVYKNSHGRYAFAVPLLGEFIRRQAEPTAPRELPTRGAQAGCDIALITVIREEYEAVRALLGRLGSVESYRAPLGDVNLYGWDVATLAPAGGGPPYRVVLAMVGQAGNLHSKDAVRETIERFAPRFVLLLGIAGGLARDGVRRGSLVVSTLINGYEAGKVDESGFKPRLTQTYPVDSALRNAALKLPTVAALWSDDVLVAPPEAELSPPALVSGPVASGDKVIDDASQPFFLSVMERFPGIIAVEMEAAGAASAIHQLRERQSTPCGLLTLRGISDMPATGATAEAGTGEAQREQRDRWKRHAAAVAAAFAVNMIRHTWPVEPAPR